MPDLPGAVNNLQDKAWYGLVVLVLLIVIFLVGVLGGKEGLANGAISNHNNGSNYWKIIENRLGVGGNSFHDSQGGPPGASYHPINDHTGGSGDWCCHDSSNHADKELYLNNPELYLDIYAPESFLGSRSGPRFAEHGMASTMGLVAPLYQKMHAAGNNFGITGNRNNGPSNLNETMVNSFGREGACSGGPSPFDDGTDTCSGTEHGLSKRLFGH